MIYICLSYRLFCQCILKFRHKQNVQTGSGCHPAYLYVITEGSLSWVKRPEREATQLHLAPCLRLRGTIRLPPSCSCGVVLN